MLSSPSGSSLLAITNSQHRHLFLKAKGSKAQPAYWCYLCCRLQAALPPAPASKLRRARQLRLPQPAHQQRARARKQPKGQQNLSAKQRSPLRRQPSTAAMNPLHLPRPPLSHLLAPLRRSRLTSNQVLEETPFGGNLSAWCSILLVCWSLNNH